MLVPTGGNHIWLYVYAGGRGREMEPASSFVSGEVPQPTLPLWVTLWDWKVLFLPYTSDIFQIAASTLYLMVSLSRQVLCFLLHLGSTRTVCWFLKFHSLSPAGCMNSWNLGHLVLKAKCYGDSSPLCQFPSVIVCFFSFHVLVAPSFPLMAQGSIKLPTASLRFLPSSMWPLLYL